MKKLVLTFILLLLGMGTSVYATPFLDGSGYGYTNTITIDGTDYQIIDQNQKNDEWNGFFGGYDAFADPDSLNISPSDYYYYDFTGFYLGTVVYDSDGGNGNGGANDSEEDMSRLIAYYLDPLAGTLGHYVVVDDNMNVLKTEGDSTELIITGMGESEGSWQLSTDADNDAINFYIVKAAGEYALYYVDPAASTGDWTTAHLLKNEKGGIPTISHLSAATTAAPVPEPATLFLLGAGLFGLAGFRRKLGH